MTNKWLIIIALAGMSIASAKSYDIAIASPCMVHNIRLNPGQYRLKLDGANAIFTDASGNSFKTTVKVQQLAKKFDDTEVQTTRIAGQDRVQEIRLNGTKMQLDFD